MKEDLKKRIEQANKQVEYEYDMLESMDFDNEEKEAKLKNLGKETEVYCALLKADKELAEAEAKQAEIEASIAAKKHETRKGWVDTALRIVQVIGGFGLLWLLGTQEAIDEHNGDIPSMSVREGRKFFKTNVLANWTKLK